MIPRPGGFLRGVQFPSRGLTALRAVVSNQSANMEDNIMKKLYGFETLRVYGSYNVLAYNEKGHIDYMEVFYREYRVATGELVNIGSEDFSYERYSRELGRWHAYIWRSGSYNKGGYKKWEEAESFKVRKADTFLYKMYIYNRYGLFGEDMVQLRKGYI